MPTHVRGSIPSMASGGHEGYQDWVTPHHTPALQPWPASQPASQPAKPVVEVLMAAGLSWFPMVHCFYEQLEAIMEMRVLSRLEQSSPSDDRPLSLGPLPSQRKLNTNGLCSATHTFSLHAVICTCTCIHTQNLHSTTLQWTHSVHM